MHAKWHFNAYMRYLYQKQLNHTNFQTNHMGFKQLGQQDLIEVTNERDAQSLEFVLDDRHSGIPKGHGMSP